LVLGLIAAVALAKPYTPANHDEVLGRIPVPDAERRTLRSLREQVRLHPEQHESAIQLARRYIQQGRKDADPRYYGYAEAVLGPWLADEEGEALLLRATIRQNRHDFANALADLDSVRQQNPRMGEAWLGRAAILEVQGDYRGAVQACLAFARLTTSLAGTVCLESALSLMGQAQAAYQKLSSLAATAELDPEQWGWMRVILGELAERLNRVDEAETWYRQALQAGPRSIYLLSTYADFLLDQNRPVDVVGLLAEETRADPLLLRLCLAEKRLNHPQYRQHFEALKARFAASRARGDSSHQGDEARFALHLEGNPKQALKLAQANWTVQREPRDGRILLEAAQAAGRTDAAQPVLEFLSRTRLEDARLRSLVANSGGHSL